MAVPPSAATFAPQEAAVQAAASPQTDAVNPVSVIVIPDRGKYHTSECRYVRGADDALELSKAAAMRQGYRACGACNP